jgi:hypothetical protein
VTGQAREATLSTDACALAGYGAKHRARKVTMPQTGYLEELPIDCPPSNAAPPANMIVYRLVEKIPACERDFWSLYKLSSSRKISCISCACSVFNEFEICRDLMKLPSQRGKQMVRLLLTNASGVVLRTGQRVGHYSWWIAKDFDPVALCVSAPEGVAP